MIDNVHPNRRQILAGAMSFGSLPWTLAGPMLKAGEPTLAESLAETARLTEGPFYPDRLPLDTDNDLLIINESITPAVGEITHLSGRVLTASGSPVSNVTVEIWQVDANAVYLHSRSAGAGHRDSHFQGFGRFLTDSKGRYYFRTVKPVPYPGRTPHIHVAVNRGDRRLLTTQLLIAGHPGNARDGVFRRLQDPVARKSVLANFERVAESKIVEWATTFDIVLNRTAFEDDAGQLRS